MNLRVMSLFSGIGGIDLGLERAGMEIIAHSEIDPYACKVLAKHWPGVPNLGDITLIDGNAWRGKVDVIAGGFPCQDISLAGAGAGIIKGKTRSGLWFEYARLIGEVRPRYVIVENVAALLNRGIDIVLGSLAEIGYDAEWDCIPASAVGAPHRRDRLFVVAYSNDERRDRWTESYSSRREAWHEYDDRCSSSVVDSDGTQSQGSSVPIRVGSQNSNARSGGCGVAMSWPRPLRSDAWHDGEPAGGGRIAPPGLHRMGYGIPYRVDRLKCLGNAVVPQVAEYIGQIIVKEHKRNEH